MTETFIPVIAASANGVNRKRFRNEVRLNYLPERNKNELLKGELKLEIEFHFPYHISGDLDNLLKSSIDVLKGSLIEDDRQIREIHATVVEKSSKGGVLYKLTPLSFGLPLDNQSVSVEGQVRAKRKKRTRKKMSKWKKFIRLLKS